MQGADHRFLGLLDHQWSALGALATVLAAVVALAIPFVMKKLDEQAERRRLRTSYTEVVAATRSALKCLMWALDDAAIGNSRGSFDLVRVAARAASRAETLRYLAGRAGLSDDAVSSCLAAAQSMDQVRQAAGYLADAQAVGRHMNAALALGHEAKERVAEVMAGEAIPLPRDDPLPLLRKL